MNSIRGGMQVHAVPESERVMDASGKRLPWGYEYAEYVDDYAFVYINIDDSLLTHY